MITSTVITIRANNPSKNAVKNHSTSFVIKTIKSFDNYELFWPGFSGADGGEACASSYVVCNNIFNKIMDIAGNVNVSIKNPNPFLTCLLFIFSLPYFSSVLEVLRREETMSRKLVLWLLEHGEVLEPEIRPQGIRCGRYSVCVLQYWGLRCNADGLDAESWGRDSSSSWRWN